VSANNPKPSRLTLLIPAQARPKQVKGSKKGTATAADKEFDILADITNAYSNNSSESLLFLVGVS